MNAERILLKLHRHARLVALKHAALLVFGLPLCLVAPLIMGTIFWFSGWSLGLTTGVSWTVMFWITAAIFIPATISLEARSSGEFLTDTVRETGGMSDDRLAAYVVGLLAGLPRSALALAVNPRASMAGLIEIFLFGPRMILAVYRDLQAARRFGRIDRARAALLLADLARHASGVPPRQLLLAGESVNQLSSIIAWLAYHQWIGLAARADKLWLPSDVRQTLVR